MVVKVLDKAKEKAYLITDTKEVINKGDTFILIRNNGQRRSYNKKRYLVITRLVSLL